MTDVEPSSDTGGRRQAAIPRVPSGFVPRPRLSEALDRGVDTGMVVVSAPAGSGKTLMLASWAAKQAGPVAWLSLEPEDADPHQLWAKVLTALQSSRGVPPDGTLARMTFPPAFDGRFVVLLVRACEELPGTRVLVLDDFHEILDTPAMRSIAAAVRRGLGNIRLVVSTRTDPPIPLQRLRLSGELTEIRAADLHFDAVEAGSLFDRHHVHLRREQVEAVVEKTEGWAAGLRLAALALEASENLEHTVADLTGQHRNVADYFLEEVLGSQTPELTRFLVDTCVVRRMSADLADTLTGRSDSQRLLAELERQNLFIIALDERRVWYRYHHLFGEMLRHLLAIEPPEHQAELHRRASDWYAAHGQPIEAARHLRAAEDWRGLARFVLRTAGAEMLGVGRRSLLEVLRSTPGEEIHDDPEISAAAAVACYVEYDAAAVHAHVRRARQLLDRLPERDAEITDVVLTTLEAVAAWMQSDAEGQIRHASAALELFDHVTVAEMPAMPAYRTATLTVLAMGKLWSGRLAEADALLGRTLKALTTLSALTPVTEVHLHGNMAVVRAMTGHLREAAEEAAITLGVTERSGWLFLPQSASALFAQAMVTLVHGDHAACATYIERGFDCIGDLRDRYTETGLGMLKARLDLSQGQLAAARESLRTAREQTVGWTMPWFLERWLDIVDAEVMLGEGRFEEVRRLLSGYMTGDPEQQRPEVHLAVLVARTWLESNQPAECLRVLAPYTQTPPPDRIPAADALLVTALAHDRMRHDADALAALGAALDIASPEGIVRPFLMPGSRARRLLERYVASHHRHEDFVRGIVEKLGGSAVAHEARSTVEPLTARERSVLILLPTLMSNAEIADELFVSVNTVKVHLKSLYRKLGVANRRQAVLRARALGLMAQAQVPTAP